MGFRYGLVGLANAGKSTLFNALTGSDVSAVSAYDFCTKAPVHGQAVVPDPRLERLARLNSSKRVSPTTLSFVDIVGLVSGASRGEGLGNRFLGALREMDCLLHVLRCFRRSEEEEVTPLRDCQLVETELMLADLESVERRLSVRKKGSDEEKKVYPLLEAIYERLASGAPASEVTCEIKDQKLLNGLGLLTAKPVLYICTVREEDVRGNSWTREVLEAKTDGLIVAGAFEAELNLITDLEEKRQFLSSLGLTETGLDRLIRVGYESLNLCTFFTTGEKETKAWTIRRGTKAQQAAGVIHSDFERGFIRAEVIAYDDYIRLGGEAGARQEGRFRLESKEYLVQDGDVIRFRFCV